jgi:GAF domain-containing protein
VDPVLDAFTDSVRRALGTPIAAITLIRHDTQTMMAVSGMVRVVLPRDQAICDTTIRTPGHLIVEDTTTDVRFADYPVVTGPLGVRSYAGCPIQSPDGYRIGALCVMDTEPRRFTALDIELLHGLAQLVQERLWRQRVEH